MELKTTKEFVLKAHSEACDKLKKEIEKVKRKDKQLK